MEIIATFLIVCGFGVYVIERLLLSKKQASVIRASFAAELAELKTQVDNQRERLNRVEARR